MHLPWFRAEASKAGATSRRHFVGCPSCRPTRGGTTADTVSAGRGIIALLLGQLRLAGDVNKQMLAPSASGCGHRPPLTPPRCMCADVLPVARFDPGQEPLRSDSVSTELRAESLEQPLGGVVQARTPPGRSTALVGPPTRRVLAPRRVDLGGTPLDRYGTRKNVSSYKPSPASAIVILPPTFS
jgi:hypothetical protein